VATEKIGRTLLVAAAVALGCSAMVSLAIQFLRPVQDAYAQLERNRAVLAAAGELPDKASDRMIVSRYLDLDVRLVDMASQIFVDHTPVGDPRLYDHWALDEGSHLLLQTSAETTSDRPTLLPRYVPVYLAWEGRTLHRLVLPVHGQGMWSTIYAYLALNGDFSTVAAMHVYRHGETPGIGDRIEDPKWLSTWTGKRVYDDNGRSQLQVTRGSSDSPYRVDLITGASVTSEALGNIVRFWLGPQGYGPLLQALRESTLPLSPHERN
jgi:Na+-transporting NADH:ubiquinone oxidoreductase subunit C